MPPIHKILAYTMLGTLFTFGIREHLFSTPQINPETPKKAQVDSQVPEKLPSIQASVNKKSVAAGDRITLTIEYRLPQESKVALEPTLKALSNFTLLDKKISENKIVFELLVDKFQNFAIGPLPLHFKDKNGEENIIQSEAIELQVKSLLGTNPKEAALKPIRDIMPIKPLWQKILPWALLSLGIIAVISGIYLWIKKSQRSKTVLSPGLTSYEIALKELKKLKSKKLFEKGLVKEYYFELSGIIRKYMEAIRDFPAFELTTEEIQKRIEAEADKKILKLLKHADLVKFGDHLPSLEKKELDYQDATDYLESTKPVLESQDIATAESSKKIPQLFAKVMKK
jgi:hypothetical protein